MKILNIIFAVTFLSTTMTGCVTSKMWGRYAVKDQTKQFHLVQEDRLLSFGQLSQKNKENQFVVIGEKNTYLMTKGNAEIASVMRLKDQNTQVSLIIGEDQALQLITTTENNTQHAFSTDIMMQLTVQNPNKQTIKAFKNKGFELASPYNENVKEAKFIVKIPVQGKIYTSSTQIKMEQTTNMSMAYKVKIGYVDFKKSTHKANLTKKILLTPLTLAADVIVTPITVGVMAVAIMNKGQDFYKN